MVASHEIAHGRGLRPLDKEGWMDESVERSRLPVVVVAFR